MRGDHRTPTRGVGVADQRKALDALTATLRPSELTVPKPILDLIPPRPPGWGMHRELFPRTTGDTFDPLTPATVAADVTIGFLLQLDRASRMEAQHAVNPAMPGLEDVIDRLTTATFDAATGTPYEAAVRRAEEQVLVDRVMWLAEASPNVQVRAIASLKLSKLAARLKTPVAAKTEADTAQRALLAADIKRFLEQMVARDAEWLHNNPDHSDCDRMNADSHLRALLLGHSLTLQVSGGEVVLGQWQRILMAELDGPRARSLRVQVWGIS